MPAGDVHNLHDQGHHVHDKTNEEFHHYTLGRHLNESWVVLLEIPYVVRHFLEIDSHARLGREETSDGFGDLNLIGDYEFLKKEGRSASVVGGIKFPTGYTHEVSTAGVLFEPELQLGSGSVDYLVGGVYRQTFNRIHLFNNLAYAFKTRGTQDYTFGDILSTSFLVDYVLNSGNENSQFRLGLDGNFQYEEKHYDKGAKIKDSGGATLLLGPALTIETAGKISLFTSVLLPAVQDLGGVHQELTMTWTAGGKVNW